MILKRETTAQPAPSSINRGSRWLGGGLVLAGVLVLAVAVGQVVQTATRGFFRLEVPTRETLKLQKEGLYVGIVPAALTPEDASRFIFSVTDEDGVPMPGQKIPAGVLMRLGKNTGTPLFQCEIPAAGRYRFEIDGGGPAVTELILLHESVAQNRADLAVGVLVCLVLGGFGGALLWRSRAIPAPGRRP